MEYRREIDGLRALAVLPVLLYHAGLGPFGGGFVGVDVFFVISGYLITSLILTDLIAGTFSFAAFYERRARRILPLLLAVVAVSSALAWLWLLPSDLRAFSASVVAVCAFASNVFFWLSGGYFDSAAELKPLLHTWSLAVEEQFYLLFPLSLVLIWRFGRKVTFALTALAFAASLGLALWGARHHPSAAFFLLPGRVWECALGSLVAFSLSRPERRELPTAARELLGGLGLACLAMSLVLIDGSRPFPDLRALLPTSGAALVILAARPDTVVGRLLGVPPLVGVGLISYGAYLWHQPLLAFARHRSLFEPGPAARAALVCVALGLAAVTWRYVERPFRSRERVSRRSIFSLGAAGSAALAALGLTGFFTKGLEGRRFAGLPASYLAESWIRWDAPVGIDGKACVSEVASLCRVSAGEGGESILLLGDSHSADLTFEYRDWARQAGVDAWQMSVAGCALLPVHTAPGTECRKARALVEEWAASRRFTTILFVAALDSYLAPLGPVERAANTASLASLLQQLLEGGARVVYFDPRPKFPFAPTKAAVLGRLGEARPLQAPAQSELHQMMAALSAHRGFEVFGQSHALLEQGCGRLDCFDGHDTRLRPLYRDSGHLTWVGARVVFEELRPSLPRPR